MMKLEQTARWAEIVASLGVIVTLVMLVGEVGGNTAALERQALLERSNGLFGPFLRDSQVPAILAKVKEIDGLESLEVAYMDRYGLTYEEASIWSRYEGVIWIGFEAEYTLLGDTPAINQRIRTFLDSYPDMELWWEHASSLVASPEFRAYVEGVRQGS